jgi:hypothetical protein
MKIMEICQQKKTKEISFFAEQNREWGQKKRKYITSEGSR